MMKCFPSGGFAVFRGVHGWNNETQYSALRCQPRSRKHRKVIKFGACIVDGQDSITRVFKLVADKQHAARKSSPVYERTFFRWASSSKYENVIET